MRAHDLILALFLAMGTAAVYAQEAAHRRCVVRIEVVDRAAERARELRQARAPIQLLQQLKVHQPFTMLLSGVLVSEDGEVLTAALDPRAELRVTVTLADGSSHAASLVGNDPLGNIALIRIPEKTPDFLRLNEEPAEIAARVDLFGHALAEEHEGKGTIITERVPLGMEDRYEVNDGRPYCIGSAFLVASMTGGFNPGSACVDDAGLLRGMVLGRVPRPTPAARELTFVLPSSRLARVLRDLRHLGRVQRAHFGFRLVPASESVRTHLPDLPAGAAVVTSVEPDGPAARGGVRPNDIVTAVDGKEYADASQLGEALTDRAPGTSVKLALLRARAAIDRIVTPGERR